MGRMIVFTGMALAMMFLLVLFDISTSGNFITDKIGLLSEPGNFDNSLWYLAVGVALAAILVGGGISLGLISAPDITASARAGFAIFFIAFVIDIGSVIVRVQSDFPAGSPYNWIAWVVTFVLGLFMLLYTITILSWVGGDD